MIIILKGDEEKQYWNKIISDREAKIKSKKKSKKKGSQKVRYLSNLKLAIEVYLNQ